MIGNSEVGVHRGGLQYSVGYASGSRIPRTPPLVGTPMISPIRMPLRRQSLREKKRPDFYESQGISLVKLLKMFELLDCG